MEYCNNGSLYEKMTKLDAEEKRFSDKEIKEFIF